jgi:Zn-dependent peptidase ImmA (M78 family)
MERIQLINPERIAWCCADHGISLGDLTSKLGIAATSIDRVMTRGDGITFGQLRKIADYFDRGVLFFLEAGPVDEARVHSPEFRTLANQEPEMSAKLKALIERVEKQRAVYQSLREDLDDSDRPTFRPPIFSRHDIRTAARIARQWLGLSDQNTFDTYRSAVEAQGVLVFQSNGYNGKWQIDKENPILGFTLYDTACPVIVIKKQSCESQQSFTLMHELGHLLIHKVSSIDDEHDMQSHKGREREANAFSGNLLVPDTFLANIQDAERPGKVSQFDEWLEGPRKAWGVSGEVILRRLLDAGRLSQSQYAEYRYWRAQLPIPLKDSGNRMYRHREPKHVFGDTFVRTVFDALNARHITLAKASSYLDSLKIKDLHQLEHYYAGL